MTQRTPAQRIEVGPAGDHLDVLLPRRALVVGSKRSVEAVDWAAADVPVEVFAGAAAHNPADIVDAARAAADRWSPAVVVAIGGASALDLGKAVVERIGTPLHAVPTTLGGSEMTRVYGSRAADGMKGGGAGSRLVPSVVVYDPALLASLPTEELLRTGMNAWAHAIEAHYARREHWLGTAAAMAAGTRLPRLLRAAQAERTYDVDAGLLEAACLAGFALNARGMGLHHAICHVLGGLTGISHAALNAAVLPGALAVNHAHAGDAVARTGRAFGIDDLVGEATALRQAAGIGSLRELGVDRDVLDVAVERVAVDPNLRNNPVQPTPAMASEALTHAYLGESSPVMVGATRESGHP